MKRKEPFVMVESRILQSGELSVYEKTVYCVLCSFADNKTGICYPSYETIAARAGCSGRKAIACIEILAEKGCCERKNGQRKMAEIRQIFIICMGIWMEILVSRMHWL